MITSRAPHALGASALVVALASLLLACSGGPDTTSGDAARPARSVREAAATTEEPATPGTAAPGTSEPTPEAEKVRDAFAGLQATYNDGCTSPGNCEYFLGRVSDELGRLDEAMKADPQGPAHFGEPLAWIAELRDELGGDTSYANLRKHQEPLTGTRDKINTWMQDHPEDYR